MTLTRETWDQVKAMNQAEGFYLGPINGESMTRDPKHLLFILSRYKFAAKILRNCQTILEVGCGEGLGLLMLLRETQANLIGLDFDPDQIAYCDQNILPHAHDRLRLECRDIVTDRVQLYGPDGLLALDVLEHVHPDEQDKFMLNCAWVVRDGGLAIWGTPNQNAAVYGNSRSKVGHVNLFTPERLVETLSKYYTTVLPFSMNDEVVHTGYPAMAHYLMAVCIR